MSSLVFRTTARARGVYSFIDIDATEAPQQPVRPDKPKLSSVSQIAATYAELDANEKDYYKILVADYRVEAEMYDKQQKALLEILDFIQGTVARHLRP